MLPAVSARRTLSVSLAESVCPLRLHVLAPAEVLAVIQVLPLSSDTSTRSSLTRLALVVPLMVCAAVWVMKSVLLPPLSALKAIVATVVVGALVSTIAFVLFISV